MRRTSALVAALALVARAAPARAHSRATVRIAEPAEDARVIGDRVRVVLVGEGGTAAATFRLELDGRPVDATGRIGGVFSTFALRPGEQRVVPIPVDPGTHELTLTPDPDPDNPAPVVKRRFRVEADGGSGGGAALALAGVAVLVAVGAAVAVRRRAAAGAPADAPEAPTDAA